MTQKTNHKVSITMKLHQQLFPYRFLTVTPAIFCSTYPTIQIDIDNHQHERIGSTSPVYKALKSMLIFSQALLQLQLQLLLPYLRRDKLITSSSFGTWWCRDAAWKASEADVDQQCHPVGHNETQLPSEAVGEHGVPTAASSWTRKATPLEETARNPASFGNTVSVLLPLTCELGRYPHILPLR